MKCCVPLHEKEVSEQWKPLDTGVDTHTHTQAADSGASVWNVEGGTFVQKAPILALQKTNSHLKSLRKTDKANKKSRLRGQERKIGVVTRPA